MLSKTTRILRVGVDSGEPLNAFYAFLPFIDDAFSPPISLDKNILSISKPK